jgi:rhodanese-related sulfurtransferase
MERSISPDALTTQLATVHLIDVRRKVDRDASADILPGATWHDPEQLAQWAGELPTGRPIVLYCVRGGSVSNSVVDALQARGLNARFIEGGIEGWKAAGGPVAANQA